MNTEDRLIEILRTGGKPSELYETRDGSRLLLLPHGARVLGLFAPNSQKNFYWTNPALSAGPREFFLGELGRNTGGDRTWLAPEIDIHFPMFPDLTTYKVPHEIDPGRYEIEGSGNSFQLVSRIGLSLFCSAQKTEVEIRKSWSASPNPLRYDEIWSRTGEVEYAGYSQRTKLKLLDRQPCESGPVGAWNLLQLPHGGTAFFPLHSNVRHTTYFGTIPECDLEQKDRVIRYNMRSTGIQKLGISAAASTGRAGYVYSSEGQSVLVIRNVFVNPAAEYIDVSWTNTGELGRRGSAFQACNVNNELGSFSELEYHAPGIGRGTGRLEYEDESQIWAFRGPAELIRIIGRSLLSPAF